MLALYCLWRALQEPKIAFWLPLMAFFLGTAFSIKYTAVLAIAPIGVVLVYEKMVRKNPIRLGWHCLLVFVLPLLPWLLKNGLAFGNPFYPLAISLFGGGTGYSPEMERGLLADTGLPTLSGLSRLPQTLWSSFFTPLNAVNAPWTPLAVMGLPWVLEMVGKKAGRFLATFSLLFFGGWIFVSSSFRHASGGALVLVLLASMAWGEAFKERKTGAKLLFGVGSGLALWLCLSAQLTTTAPYASALGLEDPLLRLKRHYSYDLDTYAAYRGMEAHSQPKDKVIAFGVYQTYPLQRIAFVDFKWKRPIFLQWASQCRTAEQLARLLREEGVRYFLYQKWEAASISHGEKDFNLVGMPVSEYVRFWKYFMQPVGIYENSFVYEARITPLSVSEKLGLLPGLDEKTSMNP